MEIRGSVAVVTGGASGLGEACVRNLVKRGAKISILDFAEEKGRMVSSELGADVIFCMTDITDERNVQAKNNKMKEAKSFLFIFSSRFLHFCYKHP